MRRSATLILLVGAILIIGSIVLYLFFAQSQGVGLSPTPALPAEPTPIPEVEIVQARVDIPANTVVRSAQDLLVLVTIPQTEFVEQQYLVSLSEVEGKLITRSFRAGETILRSALTDPGLSQQLPTAEPNRARDKAYPFLVNNLSGVADQIKPGDFVDVVATFSLPRPVARVIPAEGEQATETGPLVAVENQQLLSSKTLLQRAQVLRIVRPPVAVEPTPEGGSSTGVAVDETGAVVGPGSELETTGGTITPGSWMLVLALNDQEAELMEFALASDARVVLVLRGAGDDAFEPTIGTTLDLLISEFGLPMPEPPPYYVVAPEAQLTPQPTRTPAPTRIP